MSYLLERYFDRIVRELNITPDFLELEVKFGKNGIEPSEFRRVKETLKQKYGEPIVIHTQDYIQNFPQIRQTVVENPNGTQQYLNISKNNRFREMIPTTDIKFNLSSEVPIEVTERIKNPDLIRTKHRRSWKVINEGVGVSLDLTQVTQELRGKPPFSKFEFEIELICPSLEDRHSPMNTDEIKQLVYGLKMLSSQILYMKKVIQNSDIIYSSNERNELAKYMNEKLDAEKYRQTLRIRKPLEEGQIEHKIIVQARNLKIRDMVYGGLVNPSTGYSVTIKADGVRKLLMIHSTGLWLVYPSNEFCLIKRFRDLPPRWQELVNSVFDGEDIPNDKRFEYKSSKHYYLSFDTLMFKGRNVTNEPLEKRLAYTRNIQNLSTLFESSASNVPSLIIENKPFLFFNTTEAFYTKMNEIIEYEQIVRTTKYETDGFMFTPNNVPYNTQSEKYDLNRRKLTKIPDICKWKPFEHLTVDLKYISTLDKRGLYAKSTRGSELIEFTGNDSHIFNPETQIDWFDPHFRDLHNGTILEFGPKMSLDGVPIRNSEGEYILKPIRLRDDKVSPNRIDIAMDVWKDIYSPINLNTLKGESCSLMFRYHNRIKSELLDNTLNGSHLIDIGSGRGGDIDKMGNFDTILCIEPNQEYLEEFKRRLSGKSDIFQSRFNLLRSGGEETDRIVNEVDKVFGDELGKKPLYISMMLSLSFFWKSPEMLSSLVNTINSIKSLYYSKSPTHPLKFIFMTIEGERTLQYMSKHNNHVTYPFFVMEYDTVHNVVYIDFPDINSIVSKQTEYLVNLEEFKVALGAKQVFLRDANKELFLNKYEKEISQMYVYGEYNL